MSNHPRVSFEDLQRKRGESCNTFAIGACALRETLRCYAMETSRNIIGETKKNFNNFEEFKADHKNSLNGKGIVSGKTLPPLNIALTSLRCSSPGFGNQKAARSAGKSGNEITRGDQTFRAGTSISTVENDIIYHAVKPKTARKVLAQRNEVDRLGSNELQTMRVHSRL